MKKHKIGTTKTVGSGEVHGKGSGGTLALAAGGAMIGAAIGTIIPGIGNAVGAAVGAAVGGLIGLTTGIYKWITTSKEAKQLNERAEINIKTLELIHASEEKRNKKLNSLGIIQKDVKKEIIEMAKI
jgi:phage tail tape-measure protein